MTPPVTPTRSRSFPWVVGGCALLALCVGTLAVAVAGWNYLRRSGPSTEPSVEYVLDTSPRMAELTEGSTRLAVAQAVLAEVVRPAEPSVSAALRVFGSGTQAVACQDTDLVVPLAPANQAVIADRLTTMQAGAVADAAMGEAMIAAIRDLSATGGPHTLVVVTGGADSCTAEAGQLVAQEAARAGIELELFVVGYQVPETEAQAIRGLVDDAGSGTYLSAEDENQLRGLLHGIQAHVDKPNSVSVADVLATAEAVAPSSTAVAGPPSGPTNTPAGLGRLQLSVLAFAGQPAGTGSRLQVQAFRPEDHRNPLGTDYNNPTSLELPPGTYDLLVTYYPSSTPFVTMAVEDWIEGITIEADQTVSRTLDLGLGQVTINALESTGKPVSGDNYSFALRLHPMSDPTTIAATMIVTNTATLLLKPDRYQVQAAYPDTNLYGVEQSSQTFEVAAGQAIEYTLNLKLGHLEVTVNDAAGQLLEAAQVTAYAYPAGQRDQPFAFAYNTNPGRLPLQAGEVYDVEIVLDTGQKLVVPQQQVGDGETRQLQVSAADFQ